MWKWTMKDSESVSRWINLARLYLDAAGGRYLPGMIHNANNFCHIISMATELLRTGTGSDPDAKLTKIADADTGLQAIFNTAVYRSQLLDCVSRKTGIAEVIQNELDFYHNCLFFKHHIQIELSVPRSLPHVTLPPMALLYCLEAGIDNAVEACEATGHPGVHELPVAVSDEGEGMRISVTSPTTLPEDLDPFSPETGSKPDRPGMGLTIARRLCQELGWTVSLFGNDESSTYSLRIPYRECGFTTTE